MLIRLCIVTPRAASRLFEKGDTKLLQLAHENNSKSLNTY